MTWFSVVFKGIATTLKQKHPPGKPLFYSENGTQRVLVVAGLGFEPRTFGL
jgi:hypothetical protein